MQLIKRNKVWLLALANVIFLTFAQMSGSGILKYGAIALYLAIIAFSEDEYVIPLFLFFLPWSSLVKLSPDSISFCSVGLVLAFFVHLFFRGRKKINSILVLSVIALFFVTVMASIINDYSIGLSQLMFFIMLVAFPHLVFWTKEKISFEECMVFFSLGIISATVLSLIFGNNSNLFDYVEVMTDDRTMVVRRCGFYPDPNFYAAQVVTAIGGLLLILSQKSKKSIFNIILTISLLACGVSSVSKSFLLCLSLVFVLWLFCQMKKGAGKLIKVLFVIGLIVTILLMSGAFSGVIDQYMVRFGEADDADSLTTGRSEIWKEYINFLIENPADMFFGQGYTGVFKGVRKASHNTLIQCVYQFGIIGCVFLIGWISAFKKNISSKGIKFRFKLLVLVSCFAMWMGLDMLFVDDFFLTLIVCFLGFRFVASTSQN